jgi:hypothetical protein
MKTADDIIRALGGYTAVAREMGLFKTTVHGWKRANFIPEWRRAKLLEIASAKSVALSTADFPPVEARISRAQLRHENDNLTPLDAA